MSQRLKKMLLSAYYYGTLPMRRIAASRDASAGTSPIMVLFYHRVADTRPNPWTMSRENFRRQIEWIAKNFDVVSLHEAQQRLRDGHHCRPAVSITFDDGYAENYEYALPLLVAQKIPCTYFVTTSFIRDARPFPHDIGQNAPLPPNSIKHIQWMADSGIEIGAHTHSHADLGPIRDEIALHREIVLPKEEIEDWIRRPVRYFAFPFGQHENLNERAFRIARDAGYEAVCSAYGGYNFPGDDSFHIQRIHADPDMIYVKNWLTVDPRKLRKVRRFEYEIDSFSEDKEGVLQP